MRNLKFSQFVFSFLLILTVFSSFFAAPADAIEPVGVAAARALLVEPSSGTVLFEKNVDEMASPASLTKIMTALLALEHTNPSDVIPVNQSALDGLHPESSIADLKVGEYLFADDLIKCVMVASANDACNVLAEYISGSIDEFVKLMNERAVELGCENTQFKNTHGLTEDGHYTTANDIYKITLEAMKNPHFLELCNTASITIPATNKAAERVFNTTNHLISRLRNPDYIYHYAKGIKTGHTSDAGYCLVSTAEKGDLLLVAVVMGSIIDPDTNKVMSFVDSKTLYEWGFANFRYQTMLDKSAVVSTIQVELSSENDYVSLTPAEKIEALLPIDFDKEAVDLTIDLESPAGIDAPISKGEVLGTVTVSYKGKDYGSVELVALSSVKLDKTLLLTRQIKEFFAQSWVFYTLIGIGAVIVIYTLFVIILNVRRKKRRPSNYGYRRGRRR